MCFGKIWKFGCGHEKERMFRCFSNICEELAKVDTYVHAGECSDCLGGVVFPAQTFGRIEVQRVRGLNSPEVLAACRSYAQQLVYFSVMWLVGGYNQAREIHDDGPLATNAAEQRSMDLVVLHHYLDTTRCIECGRRSLTAPCSACPGVRDVEESIANPAILFHHKVVRQIYSDQFLAGVQNGHYHDVMAQIERGPRAPDPISPEVAEQLVHRNAYASREDILKRQHKLNIMLSGFFEELWYPRLQSPDFNTWSEYSYLALQVMEVATWILACDTGFPDDTGLREQTLQFIRPMLIHPADPWIPDAWRNFHDLMGSTTFAVYQTVLMGYLRLSQSTEKLQIVTYGLKAVLSTTKAEHMGAIDDSVVIHTKQMLLEARLTYHYGDSHNDPPSPNWECLVCLESGGPVLWLRCGHGFHKECLVTGLVLIPGNRNCCFTCRDSWDFLEVNHKEVTGNQEKDWRNNYGL